MCQLSSYVFAHVMPTKAEYILSTTFKHRSVHIPYIECYISGVISISDAYRVYQAQGFVTNAISITNEEELLLLL